MSKKVILTGLRANNDLHLGNYLGAILPMVDMAQTKAGDYQINMFVPDLHSFTTPIDHSKLQEGIMNNLRVFVASGLPLDNDDIHIYRQSYIPAHSEMTVILNSFTGFGEMSRMTQFKDKTSDIGENRISVGLFGYPVLMAADILLYNTTYVPVGDDQTQHLEFTRDIAQRINKKFGEIFTVPVDVKKQHELFNKDQGLRIRDLQDTAKKMSKSADSDKGVIFLSDTPESASKKIMSAETDNLANIQHDYAKQPGITNLLDIYQHLGGDTKEFMGQSQYGEFKKAVARKVSEFLTDFQTKLAAVSDDEIVSKLVTSEVALSSTAAETLQRLQKAVGLR